MPIPTKIQIDTLDTDDVTVLDVGGTFTVSKPFKSVRAIATYDDGRQPETAYFLAKDFPSMVPPVVVPARVAPSNVVVSSIGTDTATVTWEHDGKDVQFFVVAGIGPQDLSYAPTTKYALFSGLTAATSYQARVIASYAGGFPDGEIASAPVSFATLPAIVPPAIPTAPTNLTAKATGQNSVTLAWVDTSDVETRYEVLRAGVLIATLEPDAFTFADSGLSSATSYSYTIRAVGQSGASPDVSVSVTTDAPPIIVVGRSAIPAGADISKLKAGKYQSALTFALPSSIQTGVDISGAFTFVASPGAQLAGGGTDVKLDGVRIDGRGQGGEKSSDNAKAMVRPGDRWELSNFTLTGSLGYGLSIFKVSGVTLLKGLLTKCGSGGLGGVSTKSGLIEDLIIEGNNLNLGADSNKFTRMESLTARRCKWRGNNGKGLWLDYGNSNFLAENCEFTDNIDIYKSGGDLKDAGDGVFFEISGAMPVSIGSQNLKFQGNNTLRNCIGHNNRVNISSGEASKSRRNSGNSRSSCHTHIEGGDFDIFAFSGGEGKRTEPSDSMGDLLITKGAKIGMLVIDKAFGDVRKKNLLTIDPSAVIGQTVVL